MTDHFLDLSYLYHFQGNLLDSDSYAEKLVQTEISKINTPIIDTNLFIGALPEYTFSHLNKIFEHLTCKGFRSITIIVNNDTKKMSPQIALLSKTVLENCKIIQLHFLPWWHKLKMQEQNHVLPTSWNWSLTQSVMLTGSLDRHNRIGLLKTLYDQNLLDDIKWTFPFPEEQKLKVLDYFAKTTGSIAENFNEFYIYCSTHATVQQKAKLVADISPRLREVLNDRNYIDAFPELYQLGNFSIISETEGGVISERSYLAILHKHPFMIVSNASAGSGSQSIQKLKDFGFKTFENYFPYSDYINVENHQLRMNQIAENIKVIQTVIRDHREEIASDIEYNYNLCIDLIAETGQQIENISLSVTSDNLSNLNLLSLSGVDLDLFVKMKQDERIMLQEQKNIEFIEKYQIYRGADWPDILDENDFHMLPDWVKEECKTQFNFPSNSIVNNYLINND